MKNLILIFFILIGFTAQSQYSNYKVIKRQTGYDTLSSKDESPDSLFWKSGNTYTYYALNKVANYLPQANIIGLISALSAKADASHSHIISDVTGLQAALDEKGTSSFDGAYSSLVGIPSTFAPSTHSHTISDISNFGSYLNISDSAAMLLKYLRKQDTANMLSPYVRANVAAATYQPLGTYATGSGTASGTNTGDQDLSGYTPVTRTVNTHPLSANVTVTASDVGLGSVDNTSDAGKPVSTAQQTAINLKVNISDSATMLSPYLRANVAAATYSLLGHVHTIANTTGLQAALDAKQAAGTYATGTGSATGTNTGDNAVNSLYSLLVSNATHTGDATGSTALTVVKINGTSLAGLATGILKNTTGTGVPSIAAQSDVTALLGAGSITNTMLANAAVANLTGTNSGDQTITLTGDVTGSGTGSFATTIGTTKVTNAMLAGSIAYSKLSLTGAILNADLAGSIAASKLVGSDITLTESQTTNLVTDLAAKAPLASPAFTGTPTGIGIPVYARVTSSDATTTGQALTNVTGLTVALTTNAVYEFEAVLSVTTSAVTTGTQYGVQYSVAGAAIEGGITGPLTSTAAKAERIAALNTATSAYLTTSAQTGQVIIKGIVTTGANAGNLTIQHLKVTSGTSTIKVNSFLKVTRVS